MPFLIRRVTAAIAEAVVRVARDAGVGKAIEDDRIAEAVASAMWQPVYPLMEPV